ncbi:hypothetical protein ACXR2U_14480 [Jatrophihabitans sp. YIM 134969]
MTAPADITDIAVTGDPSRARDTVAEALAAQGFTLTWTDDWNGVATRGSKKKQMLLGAFAQYFEVGIAVFGVDGGSVVRLTRPSAGVSGGLAGRQRAVNQFGKLGKDMRQTFAAAGVLREG